MDMSQRRIAIMQLRRLLRRLERAHSGDENACPACNLQQLAVQLVDEIEVESEQAALDDLRPGAASVVLAVESLIAAIYALNVQEPDEQGRVLQALLDYVGNVVLDQLAQDELVNGASPAEPSPIPPAGPRRGGSLH